MSACRQFTLNDIGEKMRQILIEVTWRHSYASKFHLMVH